jgi:hypothetical protein
MESVDNSKASSVYEGDYQMNPYSNDSRRFGTMSNNS